MKIRLFQFLIALAIIPLHVDAQIFSEDFNSGVSLSNWTLINQDGLTPANNVSQFTDAWILTRDSSFSDSCASSTSWYSPSGQADDWLISPAIQLGNSSILSWQAQAQDNRFPDGYEVRISTGQPTLADFNLNPAIFQVAAENSNWTNRSLNLQALGYSNQTVYLAWRNNSNNQYILNIDNIKVDTISGSDANLFTALNVVDEFWQLPISYPDTINFASAIENIGADTLFNLTTVYEVYRDGIIVLTDSMPVLPFLAPADTVVMMATSGYLPNTTGNYHVRYYPSFSAVDVDSSNNFYVSDTITIGDSTYARDNGIPIGALGIGSGVTGELGTKYSLRLNDSLTSVSIYIANTNGEMTGQAISVNIRSFAALPGPIIASSDTITYSSSGASWVTFDFASSGGYIPLSVGDFFIGVVEPDSNLTLGVSSRTITANVNYLDFPGNPQNGWTTLDGFNIFRCLMIRPHFGPVNLPVSVPSVQADRKLAMEVYPNPSSDGRFYLNGLNFNSPSASISVYSLSGERITDLQIQNVGNNRKQIDLSKQAKGLYFLRVDVDGQSMIKKLIVH